MVKVEQIVKKHLKSIDGHVGFGFKDLESGTEYYYNGHERALAASTFKVPVLVELYNQVINGKLDLHKRYEIKEEDMTFGSGVLKELKPGMTLTLKDYAILMMIISDNVATDLVLKIVGMDNVNKTIQDLGLKNTKVTMSCKELLDDAIGIKPTDDPVAIAEKLGRLEFDPTAKCFTDYEDNNVTSPADMVKIFDLIYKKCILNEQACEEMLDIMKKCQTNWRLPRYFPKTVKTAHKTGSIAGVANDAGIIFTEKGAYILTVYSNAPEGDCAINVKGFDFIATLSKDIYDHYVSR
jgi:beta-lactamase class A